MNNEMLNEIKALVKENYILDKNIQKMDEEIESIRQYCLAATQDVLDTLEAIKDIMTTNGKKLFRVKDGEMFYAHGKDKEEFRLWYRTGANAICRISDWKDDVGMIKFLGNEIDEKYLVSKKEGLATEKGTIDKWVKTRVGCNYLKEMCEETLRILKNHLEREVKERRNLVEVGIKAASQSYKKIEG